MVVFRRLWVTLILAAMFCPSRALAQAGHVPSMNDLAVPVMPVRKGAPPAPLALTPLPPGAERVTPLTLHLRVTTRASGRVRERRQTMTRTFDRVHVVNSDVASAASGVEWLFERNPVDPRRASATYVAHAAKTIVVYSESDLLTMLGIPGWAHILTMGVIPVDVTPSSSPRTFAAPDGTQLVIERASALVDPQLVRPAEARFPGYRVVNVADWLEEH